ncbi:LysE family translocator [Streptomyces sp. VB1]|uniref:LysE family translocator n=1 Tax=Streptomyces sp. VB1 TaxID=2986803 RepID=UPI002241F2FC|nr:LysE family translocator [Streptomyces sp. VB1]UZI33430.1 LysE family translocator [Streptomyces sp. VB1]
MPVNLSLVVGFLTLSAVLSVIPGPSVLLETSRAITVGRRSAMWIVLGNALGGLVLLALVLAGLGVIVAASAELFVAIKVVGACYLFWLGFSALRAARSSSVNETFAAADAPDRTSWARSVRQGLLIGVANPKSIVSLMAVLPQFVDHSRGNLVLQMLVLGLAGGVVQTVIETTWVCAAGSMRNWFLGKTRRIRVLKASGGVTMIAFASKLANESP